MQQAHGRETWKEELQGLFPKTGTIPQRFFIVDRCKGMLRMRQGNQTALDQDTDQKFKAKWWKVGAQAWSIAILIEQLLTCGLYQKL
jgi:hypothetical protein